MFSQAQPLKEFERSYIETLKRRMIGQVLRDWNGCCKEQIQLHNIPENEMVDRCKVVAYSSVPVFAEAPIYKLFVDGDLVATLLNTETGFRVEVVKRHKV